MNIFSAWTTGFGIGLAHRSKRFPRKWAGEASASVPFWGPMQTWKYQVFASHLDPAELVVLLDRSGAEGWELVTVVAITDHLPVAVIEPPASGQPPVPSELIDAPAPGETPATEEIPELIPMQAFRYIFKRPLLEP